MIRQNESTQVCARHARRHFYDGVERRRRTRDTIGGACSCNNNDNTLPSYQNAGNSFLRRLLLVIASVLLALSAPTVMAVGDNSLAANHINANKRVVSYTMLDSLEPLDSYVYTFYPPSPPSSVLNGAIAPAEFAEFFHPIKRESGKRSSDADIPGVLRFGKRTEASLLGNPAGVLRFGKREVPGVLRFGKRAPMGGDETMPGVLRFGKREMSANMPAGVLRFGKKSDDMPGVLRFGRK